MRNIRFGIDIDGTVTCPTSLLPHINEQFGCSLVLDDITEYDLTEAFPVDKDIFWQWYKGAEAHIYSTSPAQAYAKKYWMTGIHSSNCITFLPVVQKSMRLQ